MASGAERGRTVRQPGPVGASPDLLAAQAAGPEHRLDILLHAHPRVERETLEHDRHAGMHARERAAVREHLPLGGRDQAGEAAADDPMLVFDLTDRVRVAAEGQGEYKAGTPLDLPKSESARLIGELEKQMKEAAQNWEFEKAALLRDQILELRRMIDSQDPRPEWEKVREQEGQDAVRELKEARGNREPGEGNGKTLNERAARQTPRRSFSRGGRRR